MEHSDSFVSGPTIGGSAESILEELGMLIEEPTFQQRMEMITHISLRHPLQDGPEEFLRFLALMRLWAGKKGQEWREAFGPEARERFFQLGTIGGKSGCERSASRINEWLTYVGWRWDPVTADDLERLLFRADESKKGA